MLLNIIYNIITVDGTNIPRLKIKTLTFVSILNKKSFAN